jgi:hypothetical protein
MIEMSSARAIASLLGTKVAQPYDTTGGALRGLRSRGCYSG